MKTVCMMNIETLKQMTKYAKSWKEFNEFYNRITDKKWYWMCLRINREF